MTVNYTPRTQTVVILQGEDDERLRELEAFADSLDQVEEADLYAEAQRQLNDLRTEARTRGIDVVLRSVGRKKRRELVAAHPPRDGNAKDRLAGVNVDEFGEASVWACMGSPVFGSDEERDEFLDNLSEAQWGELDIVAWALNMHMGADPKARPASPPTPT
jgi:hypothetical protein